MLTIGLAFAVVICLFLLFNFTRWMGIVGLLVLALTYPKVFCGLMLILVVAYYFVFVRRAGGEWEQLSADSDEERKAKVRTKVLGIATVGMGSAALVSILASTDSITVDDQVEARSAQAAEVIVLRTPGGLLEVSRMYATESFDAKVAHELWGIPIGETVPHIRVPAVYRYHVELAPEWRVTRLNGLFIVTSPPVRPSLPVAVDFSGLERDVGGTWLLVPLVGEADLRALERRLTDKLAEKAASAAYIGWQREDARKTVREFVLKWLKEQSRWSDVSAGDVWVTFADERVGGALDALQT